MQVLIVDDWEEITWDLLQVTWERLSKNVTIWESPSLLAPYWHQAFRAPPHRSPPTER